MKNMKLIEFKRWDRDGVEIKLSLLRFDNVSLLQIWLEWGGEKSWPYFQISSGNGRFFDIFFYFYRVGFELDLLGGNWADPYKEGDSGQIPDCPL